MSWYRTGFYFTSKNGRLHIYKKKSKYKGKYKSNNWYGRTFVQNKQVEKSSGTEVKSKSKIVLDSWYDELQFKQKHNMNVHVKTMEECFKEFVKIGCNILGFETEVIGTSDKPEGVFARGGDTKLQHNLGFVTKIDFKSGIEDAFKFFEKNK